MRGKTILTRLAEEMYYGLIFPTAEQFRDNWKWIKKNVFYCLNRMNTRTTWNAKRVHEEDV